MFLSICVPTYNRATLLPETIESIITSIERSSSSEEIEIIISDNASTDNTHEVIKQLQESYPFIKSRKNVVNVIDENFFLVSGAASGKFFWIFSDDDLMEPVAIDVVLAELRKGYNLLILNYSLWNNDFTEEVWASRYKFTSDLVFTDANFLLKKFGTGIQYLSSVVIRKDIFFRDRKYDYKQLHKYGNSFLYAVYVGIKNDCFAKYLSKGLIKYRGFNSDLGEVNKWYQYFIYGNNFLLSLLKDYRYSTTALRATRADIIRTYLLRDIPSRKREGYYTYKLLKKIPFAYYTHLIFLLVALPIILCPNWLFRPLSKLYKK